MTLKPVYALVSDLFFATKIMKGAQALALEARAFDSADRLVQASKEKEPALVILDCEGLEKEAFQALGDFQRDERLKNVPRVGYLSHKATDLKREIEAAGCLHVYAKSEFSRELETILARHTHGSSSWV